MKIDMLAKSFRESQYDKVGLTSGFAYRVLASAKSGPEPE